MTEHAAGSFEIRDWKEEPYETGKDGRKLTRATVKRSFSGDIEGESSTEYLMIYRPDETAEFVGVEQVEGKLGGKQGRFTLRLNGVFDGKEARARWEVVEGAGTGAFEGLTGKGEFHAPHGSKGEYSLSYRN